MIVNYLLCTEPLPALMLTYMYFELGLSKQTTVKFKSKHEDFQETKWVHSMPTSEVTWSLSGRSLHFTNRSWLWSWMTDSHPLCLMSIGPPIPEIQLFQNLTMKIHGQGHVCSQKWRLHLTLKIQDQGQGLEFNRCLLFVSWQLDHSWLRYSKFHIWLWKFKVKVMAKIKPDGPIWGLEFNRYVCFSFCGNLTIFGWDIANSIFDLANSTSRSQPKSNQEIYTSSIVPKMKEIWKVVRKLLHESKSMAGGSDIRSGTET